MKKLLALSALLLAPSVAQAAVDGLDIKTDFGNPLSIQDNHTGFGDTFGPSGNFQKGSEMDQMYVYKTTDSLGISITGNLEDNGNFWVIFLDTKSGGENTLDNNAGPGGVTNLSGTKFDAGFEPDYAVAMNVFAGTLYVDLVDLQANTANYLGSIAYGTGGVLSGGATPASSLAFNNTNSAGVNNSNALTAAQHELNAATALKGLELLLQLTVLGLDANVSQVKIMSLVTSGGGFISNQLLPGIGSGGQKNNLGADPIDLSNEAVAPGNQFATVTLQTLAAPDPLNGDEIPIKVGSNVLVATQNNFTQFGDNNSDGAAGSNGSELDALFMNNTGSALNIGITGNLEANGNYVMVFLETGTNGVPDTGIDIVPGTGPISGVLDAMKNVSFDAPFNPTHVLLMNSGTEGTDTILYVDLFDFRQNKNTYLGKVIVGSGSSTLVDGNNAAGVQVAFNNSNVVGVTGTASKTPSENQTDAMTAEKGFEIVLPFSAIGLGKTQIKYMVAVTGNSAFLSNQFLPGFGGGQGNLGSPPKALSGVPGLQFGVYNVTGISYPAFANLEAFKAQPEGTPGTVSGVVSAVFEEKGEFYIQGFTSADKYTGIKVKGNTTGLSVTDKVSVAGLSTRIDGERAILAATVTPLGSNAPVVPVSASNKNVGYSGGNSLDPFFDGANNLGLLMKVAGTATMTVFDDDSAQIIFVDDGSGISDGNLFSYKGIRVELPSTAFVNVEGAKVTVTGVSSIKKATDLNAVTSYVRVIKIRSESDIVVEAP